MKAKIHFFLILVIFGTLFLLSTNQVVSDPGDSIAEAYTASLGENGGTLTASLENDYFNFTGSRFRTYNFTVTVPIPNYAYLHLHGENGTEFASNTSQAIYNRSLVASGFDHYIIRVQADFEFTVFPGHYNLTIEELIIGEDGESLARAKSVSIGNYTDTFEFYNDDYWYNFSSLSDHLYNVTASQGPSQIYLTVYDSNMVMLQTTSSINGFVSLIVSRENKYVIRVSASEFTELPSPFTLSIKDVTHSSTTSSLTSDTETSSSAPESSVAIDIYFVFLALLSIPIVFRTFRNK